MVKKERTEAENETANEVEQMARKRNLIGKFGIIRRDAQTLIENGATIHFKTDNKPINQGKCFYNHDMDTFYCAPRKSVRNEHQDMIICEVERANPAIKHEEIIFYVTGKKHSHKMQKIILFLAPTDDINMKKIVACDAHKEEFGHEAFFDINMAGYEGEKTLISSKTNDITKFNIKDNDEKFMQFQVKVQRNQKMV